MRARSNSADVWLWIRVEWRSRWRSYLLATAVVAVSIAVVLATFTAADRSESAYDRLRAATHSSDVTLYFSDTATDPAAELATVLAMEGVKSAGINTELWVRPLGADLFPYFNLYVSAAEPDNVNSNNVNSVVIIAGRELDPANPDEVVLSERLATDLGVSVGDQLQLETATSDWVNLSFSGETPGPPDGPRVTATVVGIGRSPVDFTRFRVAMHMSPAFVADYAAQVDHSMNIEAKLNTEAMQVLRNGQNPLSHDGIDESLFGENTGTDGALGTVANALRIVGSVGGFAGAVAATLVLARITSLAARDRATYRALGWSRRRHASAISIAVAPWLFAGLIVGLGVGAWASPLARTSLAREIDPSVDAVVIDVSLTLVLAAGAVLVGALVLGLVVRAALSGRRTPVGSGTHVLGLHRPLPVWLGIRHALFGRAERGGRASRGALGLAAVAVIGAVAALVVSASIIRLQDTPRLSGQPPDRIIGGVDLETFDRASALLLDDARVAEFTQIYVSDALSVDPAGSLSVLAYDVRRGGVQLTIVRGRAALASDEITVAPETLTRLHKNVGDLVTLNGWSCPSEKDCVDVRAKYEGEEGQRKLREVQVRSDGEYRIVGEVLLPEGDFKHDDGIALTVEAAEKLVGGIRNDWNSYVRLVAFDWAPDVDAAAADASLKQAGLEVFDTTGGLLPAEVSNLGPVSRLPRLLAGFLGVLGLISLASAMTVSVRLRGRELAVLRALGMTSLGSAVIFAVHTFALFALAVLLGLPVGYAVGGRIWRSIADDINVVASVALPWLGIGAICAVAALGGLAIAAVSGWRVWRIHPARLLRTG